MDDLVCIANDDVAAAVPAFAGQKIRQSTGRATGGLEQTVERNTGVEVDADQRHAAFSEPSAHSRYTGLVVSAVVDVRHLCGLTSENARNGSSIAVAVKAVLRIMPEQLFVKSHHRLRPNRGGAAGLPGSDFCFDPADAIAGKLARSRELAGVHLAIKSANADRATLGDLVGFEVNDRLSLLGRDFCGRRHTCLLFEGDCPRDVLNLFTLILSTGDSAWQFLAIWVVSAVSSERGQKALDDVRK